MSFSAQIPQLNTEKSQADFYDPSFPGEGSFGVRVSRSGKKTFFLLIKVGQKRVRLTLGRYPQISYLQARGRAAEALRRSERGIHPGEAAKRGFHSGSFQGSVDSFLAKLRREGRGVKTIAEYQRLLKREVLPLWQESRIEDLRPRDVLELLDDIAKRRQAVPLANRLRSLLHSVFEHAIERKLRLTNPLEDLKAYKEVRRSGPELLESQLLPILKSLEEEARAIRIAFLLIIALGQRSPQILSLKWTDIGLTDVKIPGKKHKLPLSPLCFSLLRELKSAAGDSEFVFLSPRGEHLKCLRKAAKRISARAELPVICSSLELQRLFERELRKRGTSQPALDWILQRTSSVKRRKVPEEILRNEARRALEAWSKYLAQLMRKKDFGDDKIIPLFR